MDLLPALLSFLLAGGVSDCELFNHGAYVRLLERETPETLREPRRAEFVVFSGGYERARFLFRLKGNWATPDPSDPFACVSLTN